MRQQNPDQEIKTVDVLPENITRGIKTAIQLTARTCQNILVFSKEHPQATLVIISAAVCASAAMAETAERCCSENNFIKRQVCFLQDRDSPPSCRLTVYGGSSNPENGDLFCQGLYLKQAWRLVERCAWWTCKSIWEEVHANASGVFHFPGVVKATPTSDSDLLWTQSVLWCTDSGIQHKGTLETHTQGLEGASVHFGISDN